MAVTGSMGIVTLGACRIPSGYNTLITFLSGWTAFLVAVEGALLSVV
jgi:hypothetical protein